MKGKDSGEAKGYAFVTFRTKEFAVKAIKELNNSELKVTKLLLVKHSSSNICSYGFSLCGHAAADVGMDE